MKATISDYELYLYFSSLPKFSESNLEWLNCDFDYEFGKGIEHESWWVAEGVKAFKQTMADEIASTVSNATHVLPLSGGLDSRAILGGLLENLPKSQIVAATYGIPGAWDLEISKEITRKFGIQHEVFNLLDEKWDLDQLVAAAARLDKPVSVHQSYVRQKINHRFGPECFYWTGFMGDTVGGWNLLPVPNTDKREAIKRFLQIEPTPNYQDANFQAEIVNKILGEFPWERLPQTKLCLDQLLNFCLRQYFLLRPIIIMQGFTFKVPFLNKNWVNFMTNAPYKLRLDQHLYRRIIQESYQKLWNLTSTSTYGRSLSASKFEILVGKAIARIKPLVAPQDPYRSHPRTNYINWTESLRHKGNLQSSVRETLESLKHRAIFRNAELDTWWLDHLNRKKDYTVLLMNLSSLELLLQAGKF